jgi:phosphoserine aminotransferase
MTAKVHNFNPGPAALPRPVLEQVQRDLLDFAGSGMSILEMSHRSAVYERIHNQAIADIRTLLPGSDQHAILFMGGGAQTQFALVAMNLLHQGAFAQYVITGTWSDTARREASKLGDARELWSSAATGFDRVPDPDDFKVAADAAYLHYTSNNTIVGTQYSEIPEAGSVPLVCDMSSDLLSRPIDVSRFGLIYAGAQKNLGPAGVTVVMVRRDLLERCRAGLPATLSYPEVAAKNSRLNTPPVFAIYVVGLVAIYLLARGGLPAVAAQNAKKAQLLYNTIDASQGFYRGCAQPNSRSHMNVTFCLASADLEAWSGSQDIDQ